MCMCVWLCVCVCVWVCVYVSVSVYVSLCVYVCVCVFVGLYVCGLFMCVCGFEYMCVCVCARARALKYLLNLLDRSATEPTDGPSVYLSLRFNTAKTKPLHLHNSQPITLVVTFVLAIK